MTTTRTRLTAFTLACACVSGAAYFFGGCGSNTTTAPSSTASEVAVTATSGSINAGDTSVAKNDIPPGSSSPRFEWIPSAFADNSWNCPTSPTITQSGSSVTTYAGAGTYLYTPASCSVTFNNGSTASSTWSGSWTMVYGSSCTNTGTLNDFKISKQPNGCILTRTSTAGITRSITGPDGNVYAITHNTNGAGTGWDSTISPSNNGVAMQCTAGSSSCTAGTLTLSGSHLTGTYNGLSYWDHTVTTPSALALSVTSTTKTITSGTVVVQHNLLKTTSTSTFSNVIYSKSGCCFPISGTVTTTYAGGSLDGKTESLTFDGSSCGVGTVTKTDGSTASLTMTHCI